MTVPEEGFLRSCPQNGNRPVVDYTTSSKHVAAKSCGRFVDRLLRARLCNAFFAFLLLAAAGCRSNPGEQVGKLSEEFVYTVLSFSPSAATNAGLHTYDNTKLDDLLDDFSPKGMENQRRFYDLFAAKLDEIPADRLNAQQQADLAILRDQTSLALLDLREIRTALHNPTLYVETLGNALFGPYVLEYAPKPDRFRSIIARLRRVPLFLDQAGINVIASPRIWTDVAMEENEGNINLVDKVLRAEVPSELRADYDSAAKSALDAMRKFGAFLKTDLSGRDRADWRLGREKYTRKFRYTLQSGIEADSALEMAENDLQAVRRRMLDLALPLHRKEFPSHGDHADLEPAARQNQVIGEVLGRIAERHSTRESYMEDARRDLEEARAFVEAKHLVTLPPRSNLTVIPTPEFMRGIYAVGGFASAPALEPKLGAFYWVTPIPETWPAERVESKLREYNFYKLKLLTIHEAMPGHYVQMEYANEVQPASRRLLRSIFGNGPYIEGWGQYATQVMIDEGYLDHSPELALTFAKEELRVIANAILDVRLQMLNMTDQEALDLMEKQTFQEAEEATAKLQRAKLSAAQLPTYFVGWRGWIRVRDEYRKARGDSYRLQEYNDAALRQGAVPLTMLGGLLR